mgnify:CR=1 FL=1
MLTHWLTEWLSAAHRLVFITDLLTCYLLTELLTGSLSAAHRLVFITDLMMVLRSSGRRVRMLITCTTQHACSNERMRMYAHGYM